MKQLIGLLLVVVVAVAVTLMAQGNASKVLVFFGQYRIDMSLNLRSLQYCCCFLSSISLCAPGVHPANYQASSRNTG